MPKKHRKGNAKNIYKSKHEIAWTETTIPEVKRGERTLQNVPLIVPDTAGGYGDAESLALMTADQVEKHVNTAGGDAGGEAERAYESARQQIDQDFVQRRRAINFEKWMNQHPAIMLQRHLDNAGVFTGITATVEKTDIETGATIVTQHHMTADELESLPPGVF